MASVKQPLVTPSKSTIFPGEAQEWLACYREYGIELHSEVAVLLNQMVHYVSVSVAVEDNLQVLNDAASKLQRYWRALAKKRQAQEQSRLAENQVQQQQQQQQQQHLQLSTRYGNGSVETRSYQKSSTSFTISSSRRLPSTLLPRALASPKYLSSATQETGSYSFFSSSRSQSSTTVGHRFNFSINGETIQSKIQTASPFGPLSTVTPRFQRPRSSSFSTTPSSSTADDNGPSSSRGGPEEITELLMESTLTRSVNLQPRPNLSARYKANLKKLPSTFPNPMDATKQFVEPKFVAEQFQRRVAELFILQSETIKSERNSKLTKQMRELIPGSSANSRRPKVLL